ncbi:MAG: N-acetylmuramoyl-L-alanine amidase [gamma proteobacterium symbiont of Taylorina sp.]|nr:N-acetylmuramoyl-L-alanine amidase [gamma proteobacterium symbiont of Taylorina sp.]
MKVCLVIGHKESSPGACNESGLCEYKYNEHIVQSIAEKLENSKRIQCKVIYRKSYRKLPKKINALNSDLVISFHCNAYNKKISGSEVLYYHSSKKGKKFADLMMDSIVNVLKLPDRGSKAIDDEGKGGYLLKYTKAPCILIEPFFIDNNTDLERAMSKEYALLQAYVKFIKML